VRWVARGSSGLGISGSRGLCLGGITELLCKRESKVESGGGMREAGEGAVLWLLWKPTSERWDRGQAQMHHMEHGPGPITSPPVLYLTSMQSSMSVSQSVVSWATALAPSRPCFNHHYTLLYGPHVKASMAIDGQSRPLCSEACLTYTRHEDQSMSMRRVHASCSEALPSAFTCLLPKQGLAADWQQGFDGTSLLNPHPSNKPLPPPPTSLCCCCQVSPANTR
jgi:hypothetical protein